MEENTASPAPAAPAEAVAPSSPAPAEAVAPSSPAPAEAAPTAQAGPDPYSLEGLAAQLSGEDTGVDILTAPTEQLPPRLRAFVEDAEQGLPNGTFRITPDEFDALPPMAKKFVHNFRKLAMQKQNALEQERRSILESSQVLEDRASSLHADLQDLSTIFDSKTYDEILAEAEGDEDVDMYTPEGVQKVVSRTVARILKKQSEEVQAAAQAKMAERQRALEQKSMQEFVQGTPEMQDKAFYQEVNATLNRMHELVPGMQALTAETMTRAHIEAAVAMVKGTRAQSEAAKVAAAREASRAAQARGSSRARTPAPPSGIGHAERHQWLEENPDVRAQVVDKGFSFG